MIEAFRVAWKIQGIVMTNDQSYSILRSQGVISGFDSAVLLIRL